jgi:hypothetical protein
MQEWCRSLLDLSFVEFRGKIQQTVTYIPVLVIAQVHMNRVWKRQIFVIEFIVAILFLNSCTFIQGSGQNEVQFQDLALYEGLTYGQSFYASHNGLQSIKMFLSPGEVGEGEIHVFLRHQSSDTSNIAVSTLSRSLITSAAYYEFVFPEPNESYLEGYFILIDYEGQGSVYLGSADQMSYEDGAGYFNGASFPRQLTFTLSYAFKPLLSSLIKLVLTKWLVWIMLAIFLFVVPGYAILSSVGIEFEDRYFFEKIIFSIGVSLSLTPIIFCWTNLVGVKLGIFYAILPVLFALVFSVYKLFKRKPKINIQTMRVFLCKIEIADIVLFFLILLLIFIRLWIIRGIPLPLWGDSYQHTLITQLLYEHNGLFQSWEPYADLPRFTYHFGFHANAVDFQWLSGETAAQAVLIFGQILNIFSVLAVYPIAVYLTPNKNKWAGIIAVLTAGFFLNMPNFYTNWGRYTQLMGQVILLPCILFLWKILSEKKFDWRYWIIASVMVAGLAFSHYRVMVIFILFVPVLFISNFKNQTKNKIIGLAVTGALSFIIFLPWFINAFGGTMDELLIGIFQSTQLQLAATPLAEISRPTLESSGLLGYISMELLGLLLLASIFFVFKRNGKAISFIVWWLLAFVAGFPLMFYLPGKDIISGFTILIALFIPASIILGSFIGSLIWSNVKFKLLANAAFAIVCICLAIFFGRQRLYDIDSDTYALATWPDMAAANWINENIPDSARIFINYFPAYSDSVIVGSDAGWWLPYLTKNQVYVPPLNYGFELTRDEKSGIISDAFALWENGALSTYGKEELAKEGYNYIYIGQKQGRVNSPQRYRLDVEDVLGSPILELDAQMDFINILSFVK